MAAALIATQTITALAASPTALPTITEDASAYYVVNQVDTSGLDADTTSLIEAINGGTKEVTAIGEVASHLSEVLKDKTMVTKIFDVNKVNNPPMVNMDGVDYHKVPMYVSNLTKNMTEIHVLHYSLANKAWEDIKNDVDYNNKVITGYFKDLSPVVIIAKVSEGGGSGSGSSSSDSDSSDSAAAASSSVSGATGATSPKTGVASDWALWAGAAVVLLGASGMAFKKARR